MTSTKKLRKPNAAQKGYEDHAKDQQKIPTAQRNSNKKLRKPTSRTKHFPRRRSNNALRKPNRKTRQHNSNKKLRKPKKLTARVQQNIFPFAGQTKMLNCDSPT
jgi:hypothetical protein